MPPSFSLFLRPPLSQERGRMNNYFLIPKIRDLHYSLIPRALRRQSSASPLRVVPIDF